MKYDLYTIYLHMDRRKNRWNTSDYPNTTSLLLPIDTVWKPDFIIASADSGVSLDYGVATVRYYPTGSAFLWNPMSLVSVTCRLTSSFTLSIHRNV